MTVHKVSELTGILLDIAVAKAKGWERWPDANYPGWKVNGILLPDDEWSPSTNWYDGGPIINHEIFEAHQQLAKNEEWIWVADTAYRSAHGPTLLIASMRAYVASKLGEEVEFP